MFGGQPVRWAAGGPTLLHSVPHAVPTGAARGAVGEAGRVRDTTLNRPGGHRRAARVLVIGACLGAVVGSAACSGSSVGTPSVGPPTAATRSAVPSTPGAAPTARQTGAPAPRSPSGTTAAPGSALAGRPTGLPPTAAGVREAIGGPLADPDLRGRVGIAVVEPRSGRLVFGAGQSTPITPASTLKLFTAVAAVDVLGAGTRFRTEVVRTTAPATSGPAAPVSLVLVGGGDVSLARVPVTTGRPLADGATAGAADVTTLAARTAAALRGVREVRLAVDSFLFTGPAASAQWTASYLVAGEVAAVSALTVDNGRVRSGRRQRNPVPALAAVDAFAAALRSRGIRVTLSPTPVRAPAGAPVVAAVQSPTVAALIGHMLSTSDNDYAESLLRHVALGSGQPATFDGGVRAVTADLRRRGFDLRGVRMVDGSGLSRQDRATPAAVAAVLVAALRDPALRPVADGLGVAGVSGTVRDGFRGPAAAGRLRVRAKTGTLSGVSDLAGTVSTPTAGELVFAFLTDSLPTTSPDGPRAALELAAARLAQCGCHTPVRPSAR